jgi:hypothetical protein
MKIFALLLVFAPVQAWAVEGATVFNGPDVPIVETVEQDFPRYDLGDLCKSAMPGTDALAQSAQTTCKSQQGRLAGLASEIWQDLPPSARRDCVKRADSANGKRYFVLYSCVKAANFKVQRRDAINGIAEKIARQTGKVAVDSQTVGSIR